MYKSSKSLTRAEAMAELRVPYVERPAYWEGGDPFVSFPVHTRTGSEIHLGSLGSSKTACGHWLKVSGFNRQSRGEISCEKCIAAQPVICAEINAKFQK